jgi:hypothetical protein
MEFLEAIQEYITAPNGKKFRIYNFKTNNHVEKYPSVTSILGTVEKPYLKIWKAKNYGNTDKILAYANTVGTIAHYIVQKELATKWGVRVPQLTLNEEQQTAYNEWREVFPFYDKFISIKDAIEQIKFFMNDWLWDNNPQPPFRIVNGEKKDLNIDPFEFTIKCAVYGYAGSIDLLCSIKGRNILVDIKTNDKDDYDDYFLQTNAYFLGFKEMYPDIPIDAIHILNLPKENKAKVKHYRYSFEEVELNPNKWLNTVKDFYISYGNISPMNEYKDLVLTNIAKFFSKSN